MILLSGTQVSRATSNFSASGSSESFRGQYSDATSLSWCFSNSSPIPGSLHRPHLSLVGATQLVEGFKKNLLRKVYQASPASEEETLRCSSSSSSRRLGMSQSLIRSTSFNSYSSLLTKDSTSATCSGSLLLGPKGARESMRRLPRT
jgi:hypothetical protein